MSKLAMSNTLFQELKEEAVRIAKYSGKGFSLNEIMYEILMGDLSSPDDEYDEGPQNSELEDFCFFIHERLNSYFTSKG